MIPIHSTSKPDQIAAQDGHDPVLRAKAERAAEKFEGFFIGEMLKQMRRTSQELAGKDSFFKDRSNDEMHAMADQMLADALAGQRAFGIADVIMRQLLPNVPAAVLPEKQSGPAMDPILSLDPNRSP